VLSPLATVSFLANDYVEPPVCKATNKRSAQFGSETIGNPTYLLRGISWANGH
jgi:hypothetical protein